VKKFKQFLEDYQEDVTLQEGGQFGHLKNVYDVNFTFNDLKKFIHDSLSGKLNYVEEKTDGVNLMFTVKNGQVVGARNKSDSKGFGVNGLTAQTIRDKFKGRPLEKAYGGAIDDLQNSINALTDKQKDKIFNDGHNWMSVEVMGNGAENIIKYGTNELRLHGTIEFDEDGNHIGSIEKEPARMLDGMLRQVKKQKGENFDIIKLNKVDLPGVKDLKDIEKKYINELNKIMKATNSKGNDTINDMMMNGWEKVIKKYTKDPILTDKLLNRFVNGDKSETITKIYKAYPDDKDWIKKLNADTAKINKDLKLPLEKLFLSLGNEVLETMTKFMALNPDKTVQNLKNQMGKAIKQIKASGDAKMLDKLSLELDRLNSIGKIVPTEGITFLWNGQFMKLTGTFAPINQIIGMTYRLKGN